MSKHTHFGTPLGRFSEGEENSEGEEEDDDGVVLGVFAR
jgi:hypothetical protein